MRVPLPDTTYFTFAPAREERLHEQERLEVPSTPLQTFCTALFCDHRCIMIYKQSIGVANIKCPGV